MLELKVESSSQVVKPGDRTSCKWEVGAHVQKPIKSHITQYMANQHASLSSEMDTHAAHEFKASAPGWG